MRDPESKYSFEAPSPSPLELGVVFHPFQYGLHQAGELRPMNVHAAAFSETRTLQDIGDTRIEVIELPPHEWQSANMTYPIYEMPIPVVLAPIIYLEKPLENPELVCTVEVGDRFYYAGNMMQDPADSYAIFGSWTDHFDELRIPVIKNEKEFFRMGVSFDY